MDSAALPLSRPLYRSFPSAQPHLSPTAFEMAVSQAPTSTVSLHDDQNVTNDCHVAPWLCTVSRKGRRRTSARSAVLSCAPYLMCLCPSFLQHKSMRYWNVST